MPQTCTSLASASDCYDAVVVGAGPAGSVVARQLARRDKRVLLVDKATFPRSKVCGGCLNAAGVAALEQIGLGDLPKRFAAPLGKLSLHCAGKRTTIALADNVVVPRDAFDAALADAAVSAGATLRCGVEARPIAEEGNRRVLSSASGRFFQHPIQHRSPSFPLAPSPPFATRDCRSLQLTLAGHNVHVAARIVIVAAGLNGWHEADVAARRRPERGSRIGAGVILPECPSDFEPGVVCMSVGVGGYVGMVRLADGRLDVAAAFDKKFLARAGGPAHAASLILRQAGLASPAGIEDFPWFGTPALSHQLPKVALSRTFFVGDAAGYVEPFTGEGMAWAIQSACELVPIAARAIDEYSPALAAEWGSRHRNLLARRMTVCGLVGRLLRHPRLASLATSVLVRAPWLATPLVRSLNRPRSVLQCRSPTRPVSEGLDR